MAGKQIVLTGAEVRRMQKEAIEEEVASREFMSYLMLFIILTLSFSVGFVAGLAVYMRYFCAR